ncbi:hypothetical protein GCM10027068_06090 [Prescottella soli]
MNSLPWITGAPNGALPVLTGRTKALEMVTGPGSPNKSIEKYSVSGTDLGIMWDNGKTGSERNVMMLFGDTVGDCGIEGDQWRSNVLFRSTDNSLGDGMRIDSSPLAPPPAENFSKQVIKGLLSDGPGRLPEFTVIPTGGVSVGGVQYVRWMSVRSWDTPGEWTTNYSGLAVSLDKGNTWETDLRTVRVNREGVFDTPVPIPGVDDIPAFSKNNADWQMSAFVPDRGDGYVYEFGTPSGRSGAARLARVLANTTDIVDPAKYEYWTGTAWVSDITKATPVIKAPVSELSVQWNDYLQKYVAMYTDVEGLKIRQADKPEGPWSGSQTLIGSATLPGLYGGFMHPWSTGPDLYFVLTTWDRYNVIYMRTDLRRISMSATDQLDRPDPAATGEQKLEGFDTPEGFVETVDGQ